MKDKKTLLVKESTVKIAEYLAKADAVFVEIRDALKQLDEMG